MDTAKMEMICGKDMGFKLGVKERWTSEI